ncbi:MAG: cupin domain-containing protein [Methyloceanibacter sp.]|nr:cupin domain-containing protein [Methyloceanibacter sp.]
MKRWKTTHALGCAVLLLALCQVSSGLQAHEPGAAPKIEAQHVATEPLAGDPNKEIDIKIYTFPPSSATPWHIHQDSVEIAHILEGSIMLEKTGKPSYEVTEGETNILQPNVVHRGWNPSDTKAAKLYVVRIKPKGAPLATIVPPPDQAAEAPPESDYPEDE